MKTTLLPLLTLLALAHCTKKDPDPVDQLPPATQTGAGTFGCLVNGQPWTPQGNDGTSNYSVSYDPSFRDGTLNVAAYRISEGNKQSIGVYTDSLKGTGIYNIKGMGRNGAGFINRFTQCSYYSKDSGTYGKGQLVITRLDNQAGIVSGTFWFTLYKPGCDSMRVTNGRFDRKL